MKLSNINIGDILVYLRHTKERGVQLHQVQVIKKDAMRVKVRGEYGGEVWKDPSLFLHRLNEKDTKEAKAALRQPQLKLRA